MTVFEQLSEYCDCLKSVDERSVNELITLISGYTCWAQKPCETFLTGERKEVIDLPNCGKDCDVFPFEPFYAPFNKDSFTFTLIEQNGIQEIATPITDYVYSEVDEQFRLELPLPDCKCKPKCGCESNFKLMVTYVAGYDEIPDCLLPLMCEALQWIIEKNTCDCSECEPCDTGYREPKQIDYTTLTGRLQEHFLTVLTVQYFRSLSLISLCGKHRKGYLWGIVV